MRAAGPDTDRTEDPPGDSRGDRLTFLGRCPVYYGWVVVAIAFVTMAVGVNARTSFSLLYPSILSEFGWDRGATAGVFSVGFILSLTISPFLGIAINRIGPAPVMTAGALVVAGGMALTTTASTPFELYLFLGGGVVGGSVILAYTGHSFLLPWWFVRRRGLAVGIAFSGVGVGAIIIFPWLESIIAGDGWRDACWAMAILLLVLVLPLNLLQRRRPEDLGLQPDGVGRRPDNPDRPRSVAPDTVVDAGWIARDWYIGTAIRNRRFWFLALAYFFAMHAWYSVQIHQTKYLAEIGFSAEVAAYALGMVGLMGVVGQVAIGALSDRIGREWSWSLALAGFGVCYILLIAMRSAPSEMLLWAMVVAQGVIGYGAAAVYPAMMAELFHGRGFASIAGALGAIAGLGSAFGPWITGEIYDLTGDYDVAWLVALGACFLAALFGWLCAPRKVRLVAGQAEKRAARGAASNA